jgi:hypothetical protein
MPWKKLLGEITPKDVAERADTEPRLWRLQIDDRDTPAAVPVRVRREAGRVSLLLRHALGLRSPGKSLAG